MKVARMLRRYTIEIHLLKNLRDICQNLLETSPPTSSRDEMTPHLHVLTNHIAHYLIICNSYLNLFIRSYG